MMDTASDQATCEINSSRRFQRATALVVFAAASVAILPLGPAALPALLAIVVSTTAALAVRRIWELCSLVAFCGLFVANRVINPIMLWPVPFLVPIVAWLLLVAVVPVLRPPLRRIRHGRFNRPTRVLAVIAVVGSSAVLVAWFRLTRPDVSDLIAQVTWIPPLLLLPACIGFAVLNALLEEFIFRFACWELLSIAVCAMPMVVVLQAISFGLIHIYGFPRGTVGVGLAMLYGIMLGAIRHTSGGLFAPVAVHVIADVTIFVILGASVYG